MESKTAAQDPLQKVAAIEEEDEFEEFEDEGKLST